MPNFEHTDGDNLGILEEDLWSSQMEAAKEVHEQGGMPQQSAFYFESFEEFIKDPQIVKLFIFTILLAVGLPILGAVIFRIYKKMTKSEKTFVEAIDLQDTVPYEDFIDLDDEDVAPDEPEPPQLVDAENLDPNVNLTDERRVLANTTIDADDDDQEVLQTLSRIQLHGKLATAQLRARTQKLEQSMTDEEREQERETRNEQIAKIFAMMQDQSDKFGIKSTDDLSEQLKLYSV
uniref:Matrix-remodeling-associated protein 7 helical domain-containing protein n=1 Tax=Panagrolaimus superbus TaxID=310955 RepID=A0A914Y290_9BILA